MIHLSEIRERHWWITPLIIFLIWRVGLELYGQIAAALSTMSYVLHTLSQLLAPFMPFLAEHIWRELGIMNQELGSVHLEEWPKFQKRRIDSELLEQMKLARKIVELAHAARAEAKIKVRQPLLELRIKNYELGIREELLELVAEEVNVKNAEIVPELVEGMGWISKEDAGLKVALNTAITPELQKEGLLRELTRQINDFRKKSELTPQDVVEIMMATADPILRAVVKDFQKPLRKSVIAASVKVVDAPQEVEWSHELELDNHEKIWIGMRRAE